MHVFQFDENQKLMIKLCRIPKVSSRSKEPSKASTSLRRKIHMVYVYINVDRLSHKLINVWFN